MIITEPRKNKRGLPRFPCGITSRMIIENNTPNANERTYPVKICSISNRMPKVAPKTGKIDNTILLNLFI